MPFFSKPGVYHPIYLITVEGKLSYAHVYLAVSLHSDASVTLIGFCTILIF